MIADGDTVMANPFYLSIPGGPNGGLWWTTWIMGVIATVSIAGFNPLEDHYSGAKAVSSVLS